MTVKQTQWQLYYPGYYGGEIDGVWGAGSKAATVRFQKDHGLDADGIWGAQTMAKSPEMIAAIQKVITDGKIAIDGLAGLETKDATVRWQAAHGLTSDGIAGVNTREKIAEGSDDENDNGWRNIRYFSRKEFACKCGRSLRRLPGTDAARCSGACGQSSRRTERRRLRIQQAPMPPA